MNDDKTVEVKKPNWWREGIEGRTIGCLHCGHTPPLLEMDTRLYNGFGGWQITRDGKIFFEEDPSSDKEWEEWKTLADIEKIAEKDPNSEWCAIVFLPLRGATYQRHPGEGWVLVETNQGFA